MAYPPLTFAQTFSKTTPQMHLLGASEKIGLFVFLLTGNLSSIGTIFQSPSIWIATWMADPSVGNWTVLNNWTIKAGNSANAAKVATKYASATSPIFISSNVTLSPNILTSSPQISLALFHSTSLSFTFIAFNGISIIITGTINITFRF